MIPLNECKNGYIYKLNSRNLSKGVFCEKSQGFTGIREKFGDRYLDTEYHWDTGAPHGTAHALEEIGKLPDDIPIKEILGTIDRLSKRPVGFDVPVSQGGKGWYFLDTGEADNKIRPTSVENKKLFDFLDE